jgi:hypothetical protein
MNGLRSLVLLAFATPRILLAQEDDITPLPQERYAAIAQKSPFALATPTAAPAAPVASFASNWYVTGLCKLGDQYYATIKSRDATTQFSLYGNDATNGVTLASVEWSETLGRSKVVLRKGTEMASLEFSETEVKGSGGAPPAATPPGAPMPSGTTARMGAGAPLPPNPAMATQNGTRPPNQIYPSAPIAPGGGRPVTVTPLQTGRPELVNPNFPGERRRRVVPIPSVPPPTAPQ